MTTMDHHDARGPEIPCTLPPVVPAKSATCCSDSAGAGGPAGRDKSAGGADAASCTLPGQGRLMTKGVTHGWVCCTDFFRNLYTVFDKQNVKTNTFGSNNPSRIIFLTIRLS